MKISRSQRVVFDVTQGRDDLHYVNLGENCLSEGFRTEQEAIKAIDEGFFDAALEVVQPDTGIVEQLGAGEADIESLYLV